MSYVSTMSLIASQIAIDACMHIQVLMIVLPILPHMTNALHAKARRLAGFINRQKYQLKTRGDFQTPSPWTRTQLQINAFAMGPIAHHATVLCPTQTCNHRQKGTLPHSAWMAILESQRVASTHHRHSGGCFSIHLNKLLPCRIPTQQGYQTFKDADSSRLKPNNQGLYVLVCLHRCRGTNTQQEQRSRHGNRRHGDA